MKRLFALSLVCFAFGACGSRATSPATPARPTLDASGDDASYAGVWKLESGRGPKGPIPIVRDADITLQIEGGRVSGRSACNSYEGPVRISGDSFAVPGVGGTLMGCLGKVARAEQTYLAALQAADTIEQRGDELSLTGDRTELLFRRVPPPPTAELVGTTWNLETLLQGTGGEATASSAAPAELILSRDGTFTGSTGCRRLEGGWVENLNQILFTSMAARGECSDDVAAQDRHVVGVLGDGFTAEIEGQQLTIVNLRGGDGLVYRAGGQRQ